MKPARSVGSAVSSGGAAQSPCAGQTLRYRLDWRDARGWERPGLAWSTRRKRLFGATFFALGALYALNLGGLPFDIGDTALRIGFTGLALAAWLAIRLHDLQAAHRRARARLPAPVDRGVEIGAASLREVPTGMMVTPTTTEEMRATGSHAYFLSRGHLLILPARAFDGQAAFRAFVAHWAAAVASSRP